MALLALPLAFAVGCGDDDSNGNGDGNGDGNGGGGGGTVVDLEKHCRGDAEAWNLSALKLAPEYGFNLDDHVTTEAIDDPELKHPDNGCGVVDAAGGIDNAFSGLLDLVA